MTQTELLDAFADEKDDPTEIIAEGARLDRDVIGFRHAAFTWSSKDVMTTQSAKQFTLRIEDELLFKPECINVVFGPTGSGKTSLLMALLGEMHFLTLQPDSSFNLPRHSGVAYAAQESWVQNATIKVITPQIDIEMVADLSQDNILFGSAYDEARYKKGAS